MARVQIAPVQRWLHQSHLSVRVTDLNYGNHLGNQEILGLFHQARIDWLQEINATEMDFKGVGLIMADCAIQFKAEGFLGDKLEVKIGWIESSPVGFTLGYEMNRVTDYRLIARGQTGMVCFDYGQRKITRLPKSADAFLRGS